jgi:hypothetical protein
VFSEGFVDGILDIHLSLTGLAAEIEITLLFDEILVDALGILLDAVLHVDLLLLIARERGVHLRDDDGRG